MKSHLKVIWNWIKAFWWVIILIVMGVTGVLFVSRNRKKKSEIAWSNGEIPRPEKSNIVEEVVSKIQVSVTDAKVERAIIKTKSETKRQELEEVKKEPDGKIRRKKLAKILSKSI